MDFEFDAAVAHAEVAEKVEGCHPCGIFFRVLREFAVIAGDFGNPQSRFIGVAGYNFITRGLDGEAEHVETTRDVGDGGGGEYANFLMGISSHGSFR